MKGTRTALTHQTFCFSPYSFLQFVLSDVFRLCHSCKSQDKSVGQINTHEHNHEFKAHHCHSRNLYTEQIRPHTHTHCGNINISSSCSSIYS